MYLCSDITDPMELNLPSLKQSMKDLDKSNAKSDLKTYMVVHSSINTFMLKFSYIKYVKKFFKTCIYALKTFCLKYNITFTTIYITFITIYIAYYILESITSRKATLKNTLNI